MTSEEAVSALHKAVNDFNRDQRLRQEGFVLGAVGERGRATYLFPTFHLVENVGDVKEVGS